MTDQLSAKNKQKENEKRKEDEGKGKRGEKIDSRRDARWITSASVTRASGALFLPVRSARKYFRSEIFPRAVSCSIALSVKFL